jgi:hypothetical protein
VALIGAVPLEPAETQRQAIAWRSRYCATRGAAGRLTKIPTRSSSSSITSARLPVPAREHDDVGYEHRRGHSVGPAAREKDEEVFGKNGNPKAFLIISDGQHGAARW